MDAATNATMHEAGVRPELKDPGPSMRLQISLYSCYLVIQMTHLPGLWVQQQRWV